MAWLEARQVTEFEGAIWAGNEASLAFVRKAGFAPARVLVRRAVGTNHIEKGA